MYIYIIFFNQIVCGGNNRVSTAFEKVFNLGLTTLLDYDA